MSAPQPISLRYRHGQNGVHRVCRVVLARRFWAREQRAELDCDAAIWYLLPGRPPVLPDNFFLHLEPHKRPPLSEVSSLAGKGRAYTDDNGILLFQRKLTLPAPVCSDKPGGRADRLLHDELTRIYVPLLMRPWIMQACIANASCHLGVARTFSRLEHVHWWIRVSICTRWRLRRCPQRQARTSSRQIVRLPILSLPLPSGPFVAVSVDWFAPLPVTSRGNSCILLFTDSFNRCADMYAVPAVEFTTAGTDDVLTNKYIPLWGVGPASSPMMGCKSAPNCHFPCTSGYACGKS